MVGGWCTCAWKPKIPGSSPAAGCVEWWVLCSNHLDNVKYLRSRWKWQRGVQDKSIYLSISIYIFLSIYLSIYLSFFLSIYLSIYVICIYIYIYIYSAIVRLPNPRNRDSQGQEMFLAPSADNQTCDYDTALKPPSLPINTKVKGKWWAIYTLHFKKIWTICFIKC